LAEAIRAKYHSDSAPHYSGKERTKQQLKRSGNVIIGMSNYGILDSGTTKLTLLGESLLKAPTDAARYELLARHILIGLHGAELLQAISAISSRETRVTKKSLAKELRALGFEMPQASTKQLVMIKWVRLAGLIKDNSYEVDQDKLASLLSSAPTVLSDIELLTDNERLILRSLARLTQEPNQWVDARTVIINAENLFGLRFEEDTWQRTLLKPLERKGWVELQRGTRGRGSRSGKVRGTGRFESEYVKRLLEEDAPLIPPELRAGLRVALSKIVGDLTSSDTHVKGIALELLALRIAYLLDLQPRKLRLRSTQTGGSEVDLIVEGVRLLFSRWQIQCKNTAEIHVDDLAKEVGIAQLIKSHVILLVTTGRVPDSVRDMARQVMEETHLQVAVLDGVMLQRVAGDISSGALTLVEMLSEQARRALRQKAGQLAAADRMRL
jgi:site-specific DNA-methyltransferase (cytosine-N4-specific)